MLVDMFRQKGYNLAYQWTNNEADALDVLQEAFIKMYKVLPKWKPRSSIFTWLYRVIINAAIDLGRKRGRIKLLTVQAQSGDGKLEIDIPAPEVTRPDRQTASRETGARIYEAVMKLPRKQQEVFVLKHYQGLKLREIAEIQKCSLGTAKANLFQAVRKLRVELADFSGEMGD